MRKTLDIWCFSHTLPSSAVTYLPLWPLLTMLLLLHVTVTHMHKYSCVCTYSADKRNCFVHLTPVLHIFFILQVTVYTYSCFIIHSSLDVNLDLSCVSVIMISAAINMDMQISLWYATESLLMHACSPAGLCGTGFWFCETTANWFS